MKQLFLTAFVTFFIITLQSEAQISCLDSTDCTVISTNQTLSMGLRSPDCDVTVNYDVWDCGGVRSIKINSYTVDGSCTAMTDFSIYHYSLSSLEEYISLALLEQEAGSIPTCSATKSMIKIYTASCGIWVGCEYEVDPATRVCDTGYDAPYPDYGVNPTKVKVYKWQSCGEVCCENTYELCRKLSPVSGSFIITMNKVSSVPKGQCSLQSKYDSTCQNGCM